MGGKENWKSYRLDEVALIQGGGTPCRSESSFFGGDISWVTPTDLAPIGQITELNNTKETITQSGLASSSAKLIAPGSVLFSSRASIGKIAITIKPCATNQGFANFTPYEDKVDQWFLAYLLRRFTPEIAALAGKTTFLEVPRGKLKSFKVSLPPLPDQSRIVARIKECMERVDEIERLRTGAVGEAYSLESAVFADFIESLDEGSIGETTLGDVVIDCKYGTSEKANTQGQGVPVLRMGNIQNGRLDLSDLKFVSLPSKEMAKYILEDGDILINRTNSLELVGKSAVFEKQPGDWVYASYLVRVRVDRKRALPEYVNAVINSRIGRDFVYHTARRAIGMVNINAKEMQRFPLPLPSLQTQEQLVEQMKQVRPLAEEVNQILCEDGYAHLRESILRKAFAGGL